MQTGCTLCTDLAVQLGLALLFDNVVGVDVTTAVVTITLFGLFSTFITGDTIFVGPLEIVVVGVEIGTLAEKFGPPDRVEIILPVAKIFCCSMNKRCKA